jgi:hypothetical protein
VKVFVTAALGDQNLLSAASRLTSQVMSLGIFDKSIIVTEKNLDQVCPWLLEWYSADQLSVSQGFGFYAWKAALSSFVFGPDWGEDDLILYLDAGCEVLPGRRTVSIMKKLVRKALLTGVVGFSSGCAEILYTKRAVWTCFPELNPQDWSNQFQSGTWLLGGVKGGQIAGEWLKVVQSSPLMTNNELGEEVTNFIAHRHDQSVLSLVFKKYRVAPEKIQPPYPRDTVLSRFHALRYPIWAARNKTKNSTIDPITGAIAKFLPSCNN